MAGRPNTWQDPERWFWPHVDVGAPDQCWPWRRATTTHGYGTVRVEGRQMAAHRVAFVLAIGEPERDVLHRCKGNRRCCNPAHLRDGDDVENAADRMADHGQAFRDGSGRRLTNEQRHAIMVSDEGVTVLAERYDCAISTVWYWQRKGRAA